MKETDYSNPNKRKKLTSKEKDAVYTYLLYDLTDKWLGEKLNLTRMSVLSLVRNYTKDVLVKKNDKD